MANTGPQSKESVEVAAEYLKEMEGKVPDYKVEAKVREVGGKIGRDAVAGIRKALGYGPYVREPVQVSEPTPDEPLGRTRVFGSLAVAARRLGVGSPVRGQGSICQEIPGEYLGRIKAEAVRLGEATQKGPIAVPPPNAGQPGYTVRGTKRKRGRSNLLETLPMVRELLKAAGGRIRNADILRALHAKGLGLSTDMIADVRRELGFGGRAFAAGQAWTPKRRRSHNAATAAEILEKVPESPEAEPPHPLVTLVRNLCAEHGIIYLHWEQGQSLVVRESHERRFDI